MDREGLVDALVLCRLPGIGDRLFKNLVDAFGSPGAALQAPTPRLGEVEGVGPTVARAIRGQGGREWAERELRSAEEKGFFLVPYGAPGYPARLSEIPDPPPVLYVAGSLDPRDDLGIAVVGSRRASTQGVRFSQTLARDLARAGITVVSGLAEGIDAAAHRGALEGGGRTIAVFGAGIDVIYPSSNAPLATSVRANGAWLSEFPLGSEPKAHHFPRRNRVISGLSLGVVVVEATEKSGSLITAETALDQGREVFAVPGLPGAYNSQGTHKLLRAGARLVESVQDILEELPRCSVKRAGPPEAPAPEPLSPELARLWEALEDAPAHIDEVAARAGSLPSGAAAGLMELCIRGAAEEWPGKRYSRQVGPPRKVESR